MTTLNVAAVQFALRPEPTLEGYFNHVDTVVESAAQSGADLVVLPEFASMGLLASTEGEPTTSETVARDYRERLAPLFPAIKEHAVQLAARLGIAVLAGTHNRIHDDSSLRNTAILAHPDGRVELQDKLHLTPPEHAMGSVGGDTVLVTKIGDFTAGVMICADIQFPEVTRHLTAQGVDLILCPSLTWNRRGVYRVRTGCAARAMESQGFVVMSPLVGSSGLPADAPMHAVGAALIAAPVDKNFGLNDGLLAISEVAEETTVTAVLDREKLDASRRTPEPPGIGLQRPDLYARLGMDRQ